MMKASSYRFNNRTSYKRALWKKKKFERNHSELTEEQKEAFKIKQQKTEKTLSKRLKIIRDTLKSRQSGSTLNIKNLLKSAIFNRKQGRELLFFTIKKDHLKLHTLDTETLRIINSINLTQLRKNDFEALKSSNENKDGQIHASINHVGTKIVFFMQKKLIEIEVETGEMVYHNMDKIPFRGIVYKVCDFDCLNENFKNTIVLEAYNTPTRRGPIGMMYPRFISRETPKVIRLFKYDLRTKKFSFLLRIPTALKRPRKVGQFWFSYSKIDRDVLKGGGDCLKVFRFTKNPFSDNLTYCTAFYYNMISGRLLFRSLFALPPSFEYIKRTSFFDPVLYTSPKKDLAVLPLDSRTLLIFRKFERKFKVWRTEEKFDYNLLTGHLRGEISYLPFAGVFELEAKPALEKALYPKENYKVVEIEGEGLCAVLSSNNLTCLNCARIRE